MTFWALWRAWTALPAPVRDAVGQMVMKLLEGDTGGAKRAAEEAARREAFDRAMRKKYG